MTMIMPMIISLPSDGDGVDDIATPNLTPEQQFDLLSTYKLVEKTP